MTDIRPVIFDELAEAWPSRQLLRRPSPTPRPGRHEWMTFNDPPTEEIRPVTQPAHVQSSHPRRKLGRVPEHPEHERPRLKLKRFLRSGYQGAVPDVVDYSGDIAWPMYRNDELGDCTAADAGHAVQLWTTWGQGETVTPTDDDVVRFYSGSCGYDPADPSTDQGGNLQEVCEFFRSTGMAGRRIEAFFRVDTDDLDELRTALYLFGAVSVGMAFPRFAMEQNQRGQVWDLPQHPQVDDLTIDGGHDVLLVAATRGGNLKVITWGAVQEVTPAFWSKYMGSAGDGEAWARVETDWASTAGVAPGNALDTDALNDAFMALTGEPGPFPHGLEPTPDPEPQPDEPPAQPAGCLGFLIGLRNQLDRQIIAIQTRPERPTTF